MAAIALGALVVIAAIGWFLRRRRKSGRQIVSTSSANRDDFWRPPSG
jgi:LPXTG-motif cell wall-anchored protein